MRRGFIGISSFLLLILISGCLITFTVTASAYRILRRNITENERVTSAYNFFCLRNMLKEPVLRDIPAEEIDPGITDKNIFIRVRKEGGYIFIELISGGKVVKRCTTKAGV